MSMKSLILAVGLSLSGFTTPAMAFSGGEFLACDTPEVLTDIQKRFEWTDRVLLKRGLAINHIDRPLRIRGRNEQASSSIPRIYCQGTARMNDGRKRPMWWLIEGGMGFAGLRDNLEFCISGLDPLKVHGAWCRSVR